MMRPQLQPASEPDRFKNRVTRLAPSRSRLGLSHRNQVGFTLFEVVLAIGLSLLLLVGVYGAIQIFWRMEQAGQKQKEQAQVARAILNRMAVDIRSVVYNPESAANDPLTTGLDDEELAELELELEEETIGEIVDPNEALITGAVGVFGDSQTLVLQISQPQRLSGVDESSVTSLGTGSDLITVSYFLANSGAGELQLLIEQNLIAEGKTGGGLTRLAGDKLLMGLADSEGELDILAGQAKLLAEEIVFLQFRYSDSAEWVDSWNSEELGAIPAAIEITIGFGAGPEEGEVVDPATLEDTYTLVVALPLFQP